MSARSQSSLRRTETRLGWILGLLPTIIYHSCLPAHHTGSSTSSSPEQSLNPKTTFLSYNDFSFLFQHSHMATLRRSETNASAAGTAGAPKGRKRQGDSQQGPPCPKRTRHESPRKMQTRKIALDPQQPGTIVRRWEAEEILSRDIRLDPKDVFKCKGGVRVLMKYRFFIIAAVNGDQVIEYPIYTYRNNGLQSKNEEEKSQHNSVLRQGAPDFWNQNRHQQSLRVKRWRLREELRATSVARLSQPHSRNKKIDNMQIAGHLCEESLDRFLARARAYFGE